VFLGLAVDKRGPEHSTLTAFKGGNIIWRGERELQVLLEGVVQQVPGRNVTFGCVQIVGSIPGIANVNVDKDEIRHLLSTGKLK
jgi:hypothetical protein